MIVLVVDDHPVAASLMLHALNVTPFFVSSLWAAESVLASMTFDAVLLDLRLPDARSEIDTVTRVRKLHAGPLILATGIDPSVARGLADTVNATLLTKPILRADLEAALKGSLNDPGAHLDSR